MTNVELPSAWVVPADLTQALASHQVARRSKLANLSPVRQVNIHDAKSQLSKLLEEVEGGARIVIARAGRPVAVLAPFRAATKKRRLGLFAGEAEIHADFDQLPADIEAAFIGETT